MVVANPELHLWRIDGWSSRAAISQGSSFSIWVSPKFLQAAKEIEYDEEKVQARARAIIKEAGFKQVEDHQRFLRFGEFGLMHFDVPGNACGLDFDYSEQDVMKRGVRFAPHNVDNTLQQSALMTIWLMWADSVEGEIWQNKKKGRI